MDGAVGLDRLRNDLDDELLGVQLTTVPDR